MKKVLVVDGQEFNRILLNQYLEKNGIEVVEGSDIESLSDDITNNVDVIISCDRLNSGSGALALINSSTKAEKCLYTTAPKDTLPEDIDTKLNYFQKPDVKSVVNFVLRKLNLVD